jgi:UDP-sulfoquinovose synthase
MKKLRIIVLGADGYLGWATCMHLSQQGHEVAALDNYFRRDTARNLGLPPLTTPPDLFARSRIWREISGKHIPVYITDMCDAQSLSQAFNDFKPQAVVHYAEQPSAPYSMMGLKEAQRTLSNNLISTLNLVHAIKELDNGIHLIKLGTMGVYGTPNIDIEEGYLTVNHKGREHTFLYPKTPGSLYHLTKAQDSDLLYFYVRMWNLRVTDLNQGPVYGVYSDEAEGDERLLPPLAYDDIFGTVLNRFVVQAVAGFPLTVYGKGGQLRGYLNLMDTLTCVRLAVENPADSGQYRVFNQFTETFSVNQLAETVVEAGRLNGLSVRVDHIENPRTEAEEHYYNPAHRGLLELGLRPHYLSAEMVARMTDFVIRHKDHILTDLMNPRVTWSSGAKKKT